MKDLTALRAKLQECRVKKAAVREAEKAIAAAQENLRNKKEGYAAVAGEANDEFWKSGGVMIWVDEDARSHFGLSRVEMQIKKRTRSVNGLSLEMLLVGFDVNSEVGRKLKRARTLSEKLFKYLVSWRVFSSEFALIRFGYNYFAKTDKGWKKIV